MNVVAEEISRFMTLSHHNSRRLYQTLQTLLEETKWVAVENEKENVELRKQVEVERWEIEASKQELLEERQAFEKQIKETKNNKHCNDEVVRSFRYKQLRHMKRLSTLRNIRASRRLPR